MAAHLTRDADGPPPPGRNEMLLRETVDRLRGELAEAKEEIDALDRLRNALFAELRQVRTELDTARKVVEVAREVGHGPTALHWNPQCVQCQALANYDKAMGGS